MPVEVGQLIEGKYRIVRLLGEGGMGSVYEGENIRINRRVAIKVLHAGYTGNAEVVQRFEREAQAAGRIGNDHILEIIDLGSFSNGEHFIVMEYLDGEPLGARIHRRGRLNPDELAPIIRQTLVGLEAAHEVGIVHRDLKPDNIYLLKNKAGTTDFVKIIDFGISKFQPLSGDGMRMTRTGAVMGTPYYMSPEQASGSQEADQRSDLYAIGVILFEAVTGRVPFDAATFNQLMFKIVLSEVPTANSIATDLDTDFSSMISKAMARDPRHRFQSSREFIEVLDQWTSRAGRVPALSPEVEKTASVERSPATAPAKTGVNWATSHPDSVEPLPIKRIPILALVLGFAGLLVAGGGAFLAFGGSDVSQISPATGSGPAPASSGRPPLSERPSQLEPRVTPAPPIPAVSTIGSPAPSGAASVRSPGPKSTPSSSVRRSSLASPPARKVSPKGATETRPAPQRVESPRSRAPIKRPTTPDFGY